MQEFDGKGNLHSPRDKMESSVAQDRENKLCLRIEKLEAENQNLLASMEELDKQNAESIGISLSFFHSFNAFVLAISIR
jgi:predicted RNase H-like nuclease (RuvC/YqgF family)